jgi:MoaA/NifB/PqqE/SkfB family radical SAM enzyme
MCLVTFSKTPSHSGTVKLLNREENKPTWAYISIMESCSHKCSWCYGNYKENEFGAMPIETFETVTDKLLEMGMKQITFSGGEPTEHPEFLKFVEIANNKGFHIHIATHGEHLDQKMIDKLLEFENFSQVQMNYQGKKRHDQIHGQGLEEQLRAFELLKPTRIETVATITVGAYNIKDIDIIMKEADELGVTRLRVIDATGRGVIWRKMDLIELFDTCKAAAEKLGYKYVLSYDPEYEGDITVPCLQLSNLYMHIDPQGRLQYCGAVLPQEKLADFNTESIDEIMNSYYETNNHHAKNGIYCRARVVTK